MCILFWYNALMIFSHFFCFVNLVFFWHVMLSKCIDSGYLELLLQFSTDCFETLLIFFLHGMNEDKHVVWVQYFDYFFSPFLL